MADSAWQPGTPLTGPAGRGAEQRRWAQAFPPGRARAPQLSRASMASGVTSVGSPFLAGNFLPASSAWNSCLRVDSTVSCSSGVFPAFSPSGRQVLRERCRPPPRPGQRAAQSAGSLGPVLKRLAAPARLRMVGMGVQSWGGALATWFRGSSGTFGARVASIS